MLLIYEIELPKDGDVAAFSAFMRDQYIRAVRKGPTRVGQVTQLEVLQRAAREPSHRFLLLVRWDGLNPPAGVPVDDEDVQRRLAGFGVTMSGHIAWQEVAEWPLPTE